MVAVTQVDFYNHGPNDEVVVKENFRRVGVPENGLPTTWPEGRLHIVASSAVHRVTRPEFYFEDQRQVPRSINPVQPRPIMASGETPEAAWRMYRELTGSSDQNSCLRVQTPEGNKYVRFAQASVLTHA